MVEDAPPSLVRAPRCRTNTTPIAVTTSRRCRSYDGAPTYQTIATHGDGIKVVIPPRSTAVPRGEPGPPTQRDRHLAMIADQGRLVMDRGFVYLVAVMDWFSRRVLSWRLSMGAC